MLVLTGDSTMGLAIIRSLGRAGVDVVAATAVRDGVGRFSRYCRTTVPMPPPGEHLADDVLSLAAAHGVTEIVATSEALIVALNAARERLEPRVRLLFPDADTMALALHKDRTLDLAAACGIPAPRTVHPHGPEDLRRCRELQYPVILKPARRDAGGPTFKLQHAETFDELVPQLARISGEYPLVQEFVPGHGVGIEALCRDGEPLLLFQHRRVRELPPEGGASVLCESVRLDSRLADMATRLLRAMRWNGVAMVEFRHDPESGETYLMEVNGRFWGSLPLALHAGADFPALLRETYAGRSPRKPRYRAGVRCRDIVGDTRWLVSVLISGHVPRWRAVLSYLAAFRPGMRHYTWASDDPLPALMGVLVRLRKALTG